MLLEDGLVVLDSRCPSSDCWRFGQAKRASKSHVDPLSASKTNDLKSHGRVVDEKPEKQLQIIDDEKARKQKEIND